MEGSQENQANSQADSESGQAQVTQSNLEDKETKLKFMVMYLGSTTLDRRCPPQHCMHWLMAEVKRRRESIRETYLEVMPHSVVAVKCDAVSSETIFDHKLQGLSRFAKMQHDPCCFGYLRRQTLYSDFECHVFIAHEEKMVPELFSCIRDATQRDLFEDMGDQKNTEPAKAFYEVMYLGRAKVKGKNVGSSDVDELVKKLLAREVERDRQRHASGTSIKSLPISLEEQVSVTENELQDQHRKLFTADIYSDSPSSSIDELSQDTSTLDSHDSDQQDTNASDQQDSSTENLVEYQQGMSQLQSSDPQSNASHSSDEIKEHQVLQETQLKQQTNRTMLFRLGQQEISLISLDKKTTILEVQFKNISSVSQGNNKGDVFGFIVREPPKSFTCHLLRCHSACVVNEIMNTLRSTFQTAYDQRRLQMHQICINCPLHQYSKLCQEISVLGPSDAYELLCKKIQMLPEKDSTDLYHSLKSENPQSYEESVEVLMIALKNVCELRQREHAHISDSGKGSPKSEFNLLDSRGRSGSISLTLDNLTQKAKKKLANSFENLLSKAHVKRDEMREAFRHRSMTTDSEGSITRNSFDSSPDHSPLTSPAAMGNNGHYEFPSPPSSPINIRRARSSTVGALPELSFEFKSKLKDYKQEEKVDSSHSPIKNMFILASSKKKEAETNDESVGSGDILLSSPSNYTPKRKGSWRQEIFNRVVTPVRHSQKHTLDEDYEGSCVGTRRSSEEIRALWKKAIMETLLLIRMEKENQDLRARQDEMHLKRQKLHYEEITPCLKEVTKVWEEMLSDPARNTVKFDNQKLIECVRQGVPQSKREEIWWLLVEQHHLHYPELMEKVPEGDYPELLKQLTTHQHAILIDLGRTFPGHPYFSTQLGPGQLALFNLLKAYSLLDQEVGYCQGLSFVAGILLMHMEETMAFEAWKHLMFNLGLRKQYRPNMIALQIQLYQLTRLIHDNYRDLYKHFEEHEISPTLYAAPWFLTLFASQFPLGFVARVYDLLLIQGLQVIFKVALELLGNHRELILQCDSFESIMEFIKTTLPEMSMIQMERVINQAFLLDISMQLQAYEVEYHVLKEEMMYSPVKGESDIIQKLEQVNHNLKQQNMELLEKLQQAHSQQRSIESMLHNYQTSENKLKSHIRTLEIERAALLNAVAKLKQLIPEVDQRDLDISLPVLSPSLPPSPVHFSNTEINRQEKDSSDLVIDRRKSARFHPDRDS
ncbi:hypothetical protein CHS0354_021196 [Potamilus streckersoni]|uniref:TBC1 domain family member 4 n=2 Tax=Potamilus streckersoni TaxID=2493646 RepID=A0AAE0SSD9_9BIVA|nr:hypothetical protein CHS0354_021196 [Potamilus streckersoni]